MSGPGQYLPDPTEGITRPQDLPAAKIVRRSRNFKRRPCPRCDQPCFRHAVFTHVLHDVGDLVAGRPREIHLTYSQHHCPRCAKFFNVDTSDYALPLPTKWSPRGAHLVLQTRTRVLNNELRQTFQQWYPGMQNDGEELKEAA